MKIGLNIGINKEHKKFPRLVTGKAGGEAHERVIIEKNTDKPVRDRLATQHQNLKMLNEKHNDGKIVIKFLIVGARLIAYHFW